MVLKIALVDDEKEYLLEMERLCRDYQAQNDCPMEISSFSDSAAFLKALESTAFSLVFLDIYMEGTDGITAAKALRAKDSGCLLVFLTSSSEFMQEAFSCHAFEYITKPIDPCRVKRVLEDAAKLLPPSDKFVTLTSNRKTVRLFLSDIVAVVTDAHYLEFFLTDGSSLRCRMTLPEFQHLSGHDPRFILANRGVLMNASHILSFENNCYKMNTGLRLPLRIKDAGRVEQEVRNYNFEMIRRRQNTVLGKD